MTNEAVETETDTQDDEWLDLAEADLDSEISDLILEFATVSNEILKLKDEQSEIKESILTVWKGEGGKRTTPYGIVNYRKGSESKKSDDTKAAADILKKRAVHLETALDVMEAAGYRREVMKKFLKSAQGKFKIPQKTSGKKASALSFEAYKDK